MAAWPPGGGFGQHVRSLHPAALAYLAMAVEVHGPVLRFADWAPSTALLVVDLGFLAGMGAAEVAFLACVDLLMIVGGFAAYISDKPLQIWTLYTFSCECAGTGGADVEATNTSHPLPSARRLQFLGDRGGATGPPARPGEAQRQQRGIPRVPLPVRVDADAVVGLPVPVHPVQDGRAEQGRGSHRRAGAGHPGQGEAQQGPLAGLRSRMHRATSAPSTRTHRQPTRSLFPSDRACLGWW